MNHTTVQKKLFFEFAHHLRKTLYSFSLITFFGCLFTVMFTFVGHAEPLKKPPLRNPRECGRSLRLDGEVAIPFGLIGILHRLALLDPQGIDPVDERYEGLSEYMEKLRSGKLSEEEKYHPPHFFYKSFPDDPVVSIRFLFERNQDEGNLIKLMKQCSKQQKQTYSFTFDGEKTYESGNDKQRERLVLEKGALESKYQEICLRLQAWAKNFDKEALQQVQIRKKFIEKDFDLEHQWITAKIHQALESCSYGWLANIIIVTESHDRYDTAELSFICESNQQGYWGPLIVVSVDSQEFMYAQEEIGLEDARYITTLFVQKIFSYYFDQYQPEIAKQLEQYAISFPVE